MLTDWKIRLRALVNRSAVEREVDEELRFHVGQQVERDVERGLEREEATRRARLAFGGLDQVKEECRDARGTRVVDDLWRDVSYGVRMLARRPLSSATAIATVAVGIGLNAAVFSVVDWVLLRPLPYPSPQELVRVFSAGAKPVTPPALLTSTEFDTLSQATTFRAGAAFSTATRVIAGLGLEPAHVVVARVAGDLFGTLGVSPESGRTFDAVESHGGAPVVVISAELWRRRLSADPNVVGRVLTIDGQAHRVIGIMAADRGYPNGTDVWRPLTASEREDDDREQVMIARLAPGVSRDRANLEMAALASASSNGDRTAWAEDLQRTDVRDVRAALVALLAAAALVLVIACANVAALLAARGADRAGELAVRRALGATPARLLQQLLTETLLLTVAGGAAGLVLAGWGVDVLVSLAPADLPRLGEITVDRRVVLVSLGATAFVGLVAGLLTARRPPKLDVRRALGAAAPARVLGRAKGGRSLVVVQTALAVVLTVGAGLLGRSLQHLLATDHGFAADRLIGVELYLRGGGADTPRLFRALIESAESVSRVHSAAVALRQPHQVAGPRVSVRVAGLDADRDATVTLRPVTSRYFETTGLSLTRGRGFTADDRRAAPRVAVVNAAFVREVLSGRRAVGARLTTNVADGELTVVGEVADVTPAGEADRSALYVPVEQLPIGGGALLVRTTVPPAAVLAELRTRIRAAAPGLALDRMYLVSDALAASRAATRFNTQLASAFAGLALLLSAIAVYGLTAGEVATRWRELAVRLALGASARAALWTAIGPSAGAVGGGIAIGLVAAVIAARGMTSLLHGVGPADPSTLLMVPALFALVGLTAAWLAAARVLRADPATTLRSE